MAKKKQSNRRISIRSVRKNPPDLNKLGRALIALAMAQAEAEAQGQDAEAEKTAGGSDQTHPEDET
jgi:branched-subunit amino acid aminotransferase/4-amino-4-deoxychorismate lyase